MHQQMRNSSSSYEEIMVGKSERRNNHVMAVRMASPSMLDDAALRIKEVMRKPESARRQRIAPPAFAV
ncbi:hypothetical protein ACE0DR_27660 [Azotobacter sp. CWF10]